MQPGGSRARPTGDFFGNFGGPERYGPRFDGKRGERSREYDNA
jgi:hypothetical protein